MPYCLILVKIATSRFKACRALFAAGTPFGRTPKLHPKSSTGLGWVRLGFGCGFGWGTLMFRFVVEPREQGLAINSSAGGGPPPSQCQHTTQPTFRLEGPFLPRPAKLHGCRRYWGENRENISPSTFALHSAFRDALCSVEPCKIWIIHRSKDRMNCQWRASTHSSQPAELTSAKNELLQTARTEATQGMP